MVINCFAECLVKKASIGGVFKTLLPTQNIFGKARKRKNLMVNLPNKELKVKLSCFKKQTQMELFRNMHESMEKASKA